LISITEGMLDRVFKTVQVYSLIKIYYVCYGDVLT